MHRFVSFSNTGEMLTLWFDGLYRSLPGNEQSKGQAGFMCYGWLITHHGELVAQGHGTFAWSKNASSFIAEYLALIEGLEALLDLGVGSQPVEIHGDAKTVIDQMRGEAEVNCQTVKPLYRRACKLAARLVQPHWTWRPRRENRAADQLSRRAMRQFRSNKGVYQPTLNALLMKVKPPSNFERLIPVASVCVYL